MRRSVVLLVVVVLVAASSVTTWVVAGAATKGKISGCVDDETGEIDQLRFGKTPAGGECDEGETALTWNVRGRRGPEGPQGPQGPAGPAGAGGAGPQGPPGVLGVYHRTTTGTQDALQNNINASCDTGDPAVGGFYSIFPTSGAVADTAKLHVYFAGITGAVPANYQVGFYNPDTMNVDWEVQVVCLDMTP